LTHTEALRFIAECEASGTRIIDMEFFVRGEGRITPVGGTAWDDLLSEPAQQSWRESRDLLRDGIPDGGSRVVIVAERSASDAEKHH
jgi:hypothetical protein